MIDLDRFKKINDSLGRDAGDEVLRACARAASAVIRGDDVIGRWGGEEFLLQLSAADCEGAIGVLDRLRQRISVIPG